jgi:pimeloyl-ACP methyl ester carboxylesterase
MSRGGPRAAEVISFDGTRLAAELRGTGDGLRLLAVPGIGARAATLRAVLEPLTGARPVAAWDLRGLHDSEPPASGRLGVDAQVEDALAVLDALNRTRFLGRLPDLNDHAALLSIAA